MGIKINGNELEQLASFKTPSNKEQLRALKAEADERERRERRERRALERRQFEAFSAAIKWRPVGANVLARALDMHHQTVQNWLDSDPNAPKSVELGGRQYFDPADLAAWWNAKALKGRGDGDEDANGEPLGLPVFCPILTAHHLTQALSQRPTRKNLQKQHSAVQTGADEETDT